jgi:hypothetical protein
MIGKLAGKVLGKNDCGQEDQTTKEKPLHSRKLRVVRKDEKKKHTTINQRNILVCSFFDYSMEQI